VSEQPLIVRCKDRERFFAGYQRLLSSADFLTEVLLCESLLFPGCQNLLVAQRAWRTAFINVESSPCAAALAIADDSFFEQHGWLQGLKRSAQPATISIDALLGEGIANANQTGSSIQLPFSDYW
jgi:hypothetical protein